MNLPALLVALDVALTGKGFAEALHTCRVKSRAFHDNPAEWLYRGELYYLSDGGYSRVFFHELSDALCIASESLEGLKERWGKCPVARAVRGEIERRIREWAEAQ